MAGTNRLRGDPIRHPETLRLRGRRRMSSAVVRPPASTPSWGGPAMIVAAATPVDERSLAARTRNRLLGSTAAIGAAFALSLSWSAPVGAGPSGGKVAGGSATIQHSGSTTTVASVTDRTIINWQSFSVGAGEAAKFVQPNSASAPGI